MSNPNPSPSTRFQPGVSGNPKGRPKKTPAFDELMAVIGNDPEGKKRIAEMWFDRILKGDYQFFRDFLERSDGKVPSPVEVTEKNESDTGVLVRVPTVPTDGSDGPASPVLE
jgi:hypothetical protein